MKPSTVSRWFPRPSSSAAVDLLGPGASLSVDEIVRLLHSPAAIELRHKVGVTSPADGSARTTTRLLQSEEWLFKADASQCSTSSESLRTKLKQSTTIAASIPLWHPQKSWLLLQTEDERWWPASVCPLLLTLRELPDPRRRLASWTRMIAFGLEINARYSVGLDLNPSNFGVAASSNESVYYLDDEIYPRHTLLDFAETIVARLREEPTIHMEDWRDWGRQLQPVIRSYCTEKAMWGEFLDALRNVPLPNKLIPLRDALLNGLVSSPQRHGLLLALAGSTIVPTSATGAMSDSILPSAPAVQTARPPAPRLTCVFADVHGNLPALDAVLRAAADLNADSYLFLGDAVGYGPFPKECIRKLDELADAVLLQGNHDFAIGSSMPDQHANRIARESMNWTSRQLTSAERAWLLRLPREWQAEACLAVHGAPICPDRIYAYVYELTYKDNLDYLQQVSVSCCFYGHSHVPFVYIRNRNGDDEKRVAYDMKLFHNGQTVLINPGSVGQPRDGDWRASFALWDRINHRLTFHRVEYPIQKTLDAILASDLPEDLARRLEIGR